jgi:hypothetical protein
MLPLFVSPTLFLPAGCCGEAHRQMLLLRLLALLGLLVLLLLLPLQVAVGRCTDRCARWLQPSPLLHSCVHPLQPVLLLLLLPPPPPLLLQVAMGRRTDRWVNDVTKLMLDSGILAPDRIYIYMVRPLRPAPTHWQRAKRVLGRPLCWARLRLDKKARARARAIRRVAA